MSKKVVRRMKRKNTRKRTSRETLRRTNKKTNKRSKKRTKRRSNGRNLRGGNNITRLLNIGQGKQQTSVVDSIPTANVMQVVHEVPSFVHDLDDMKYECTLEKFGIGQDVKRKLRFYTDRLEFKSRYNDEKVEILIQYNNIINVTVNKKKRLCIDYKIMGGKKRTVKLFDFSPKLKYLDHTKSDRWKFLRRHQYYPSDVAVRNEIGAAALSAKLTQDLHRKAEEHHNQLVEERVKQQGEAEKRELAAIAAAEYSELEVAAEATKAETAAATAIATAAAAAAAEGQDWQKWLERGYSNAVRKYTPDEDKVLKEGKSTDVAKAAAKAAATAITAAAKALKRGYETCEYLKDFLMMMIKPTDESIQWLITYFKSKDRFPELDHNGIAVAAKEVLTVREKLENVGVEGLKNLAKALRVEERVKALALKRQGGERAIETGDYINVILSVIQGVEGESS